MAATEATIAGSKGVGGAAEGPGAGAIASADAATFWTDNAATTIAANTTFIFNAIITTFLLLLLFFVCVLFIFLLLELMKLQASKDVYI